MWITAYRKSRNLELYELQQLVNDQLHRRFPWCEFHISEKLIYLLEHTPEPKTHPIIATVIADVCHATPEQFNEIVHPKRQGGYIPNYPPDDAKPVVIVKSKSIINPRPVVKVDMTATVVARFLSAADAAKEGYIKSSAIIQRCKRNTTLEFKPYYDNRKKKVLERPYTYRYADEWDTMSREQQIMDIYNAKEGVKNSRK